MQRRERRREYTTVQGRAYTQKRVFEDGILVEEVWEWHPPKKEGVAIKEAAYISVENYRLIERELRQGKELREAIQEERGKYKGKKGLIIYLLSDETAGHSSVVDRVEPGFEELDAI